MADITDQADKMPAIIAALVQQTKAATLSLDDQAKALSAAVSQSRT